MGYLSDNIPRGRFYVECEELYRYRLIVTPGFASDANLRTLVKDVLPDVEEWQFSGRRFRRKPRYGKRTRVIHPATYAQNSRKMREFDEEVVFAFNSPTDRASVAARLNNNGFTYRLENESENPGEVIILVP